MYIDYMKTKVITVLRYATGELLGYGCQPTKDLRIGTWAYFHKNGQLWQKGDYDHKGKRIRKTWHYFDEQGEEFGYLST